LDEMLFGGAHPIPRSHTSSRSLIRSKLRLDSTARRLRRLSYDEL